MEEYKNRFPQINKSKTHMKTLAIVYLWECLLSALYGRDWIKIVLLRSGHRLV